MAVAVQRLMDRITPVTRVVEKCEKGRHEKVASAWSVYECIDMNQSSIKTRWNPYRKRERRTDKQTDREKERERKGHIRYRVLIAERVWKIALVPIPIMTASQRERSYDYLFAYADVCMASSTLQRWAIQAGPKEGGWGMEGIEWERERERWRLKSLTKYADIDAESVREGERKEYTDEKKREDRSRYFQCPRYLQRHVTYANATTLSSQTFFFPFASPPAQLPRYHKKITIWNV